MFKRNHFLLGGLMALMSMSTSAQFLGEPRLGDNTERHTPSDRTFMQWSQDPQSLNQLLSDRFETRDVAVDELETIKLKNVVPPIHFDSGRADIPPGYVDKVRAILDSMKGRKNVRLHFVGHADNQRLSGALALRYSDNVGLSRERAGEVAEYFKNALRLPADAISYDWVGDAQPIVSNDTAAGRAQNRRVEVEVWYDQPRLGAAKQEVLVKSDIKRVKVCRIETVCKLRYREGNARRTRVKNLVAPLHYTEETIDVAPEFIKQIEQALYNLRDKTNVQVRFVGYSDSAPLSGRDERIYGDHVALSKARAHRVALTMQETLKLPTAAVASDGRGASTPLASNETLQGRALNRRVEVEFWHDDPLQELPDEPQMCPSPDSAHVKTKIYEPSWGPIAPLALENGAPTIPAGYVEQLRRAMTDVREKDNVRLRFVGYAKNEHLDRRVAVVYGDDIGLSAARARRAKEAIQQAMGLTAAQVEHEGRGYVTSSDVVNAGFVQGDVANVVVQVVYDEPVLSDALDGVDIVPLKRELQPKDPFALNLMRISVDGQPIDDPERSSADVQRCTDVALERADIQFRFDNLKAQPRLSVAAAPTTATMQQDGGKWIGAPVRFRMYGNYLHFIDRAEVRVFNAEQSTRDEPLAIVQMNADGLAEWAPEAPELNAPKRELRYVLRAYDKQGAFDETIAQSLWLVLGDAAEQSAPGNSDAELLSSYGDSNLAVRNIPIGSGAIKVNGAGIPAGRTVWVAGHPTPVDADGKFVAEAILPPGAHTVEVAVLDDAGNGTLYLRDLEFKRNDWFYVGIGDLTYSKTRTEGPMNLLQGQNAPYDYSSSLDGRLAFFVDGKFSERWKLTASADTREGPVGELFSNFMSKSPDALFRRIDPDYFYPTYGDDSTVEEMAPTSGKFYVKASKDKNYGMWGNFKVAYMNNELAQVDRGMYGGNVRYGVGGTTSFGEQRFVAEGFAAEPGTVPSREDFRGTGGSLYYLHRQDILRGSERVRIELRDKDSRMVMGVVELRPGLDYDIDYLQGRVLLAEPLAPTADDHLLVRAGALSGDEAYLVVRYEYTPGFDQLTTLSTGGQTHYWVNDHLKVGFTTSANGDGAANSNLSAADVTLRKSANSWFKLQSAKSEGLASNSLYSADGGFGFATINPNIAPDASADAYRADLSVGFDDFFKSIKGRATFYTQDLGAGYSSPGLSALTDTQLYGGKLVMPITDKIDVTAKADSRVQQQGLETQSQEVNVAYKLTDHWTTSAGYRNDTRRDNSPIVPLTQVQGDRQDAVLQVGYDSKGSWRSYGYVQQTLATTDNREKNGRVGLGGAYRVTDRFSLESEVSQGDLGAGARLGTNYLYSPSTNLYLNYALENERSDNGLYARRGNLISGVKKRLSDSSSVYVEERYQDTDRLSGLTHATGVTLAPSERWNVGANVDFGDLRDDLTGANTQRKAGGVRVGYGVDSLQWSSAVEYRSDETEQPNAAPSERTTWLFRNNIKYQITPSGRLLGKFNHSISESTLGTFYDGGFTEAVVGYAYRPVANDRFNALAKYTYFYNVPTVDQITLQNTAAEFIQKSHIAALDATYDLTPRWSIGGKYAYRMGQVSIDRQNPEFFDNRAQLYIVRVDCRFGQEWEAMAEARTLDMPDLNQTRAGALLGLYRYIGKHIKLGAGYNFTDFSDDLTDLSFTHQGAFVNVVGML